MMIIFLRKFCFLFLTLLCLSGAGQALAAPVVRLDTAPAPPVVGSSLEVSLIGENFLDLYAFNFTLSYDPALIRAVSVEEGSLLPSAGSSFFIPGVIDNVLGTISFTGASLLGAISGAGGNGSLAIMHFEVLAAGMSQLALSDLLFLDSDFMDVNVVSQDMTLNIPGGAVPEPASLPLILIGLGACLYVTRLKRGNLS